MGYPRQYIRATAAVDDAGGLSVQFAGAIVRIVARVLFGRERWCGAGIDLLAKAVIAEPACAIDGDDLEIARPRVTARGKMWNSAAPQCGCHHELRRCSGRENG